MPWRVSTDVDCPASDPYGVVKSDTGELVACHATAGEAMAQVHALYANMPMGEK